MLIPITRTVKNFYLLYYGFTAAPIYVETQPACASCVYMSYSIYRPVCRPYQVHMHIL